MPGKVPWHRHFQVDYVLLQRLSALEVSRQRLIACSIQSVQRPESKISGYCLDIAELLLLNYLNVLLATTTYCASSTAHPTIIQPEFL